MRNSHTRFTVILEKQPQLCLALSCCCCCSQPPIYTHLPPPTPTAVKGRDPTQNLEAGSQWLFLFCTAITEHQIIRCCPFVWFSGSHGFYASCTSVLTPAVLLFFFRSSIFQNKFAKTRNICTTLHEMQPKFCQMFD